jgi:hypothetical protein
MVEVVAKNNVLQLRNTPCLQCQSRCSQQAALVSELSKKSKRRLGAIPLKWKQAALKWEKVTLKREKGGAEQFFKLNVTMAYFT